MARKAAADSVHRRSSSDIVGIILLAFALLFSVALFSYDRNDLSYNFSSPNHPVHNWIGPIGAYSAY
jgi:hypothetical protein